ncbi:hypothetical protein ACJMK2_041413 [Sinanodonta woodiana]|uniref:Uncharacterized protein n=1 Tax=Sinanodonta woodiana TaxID=1069815 RepID=A0ABD3W430_SINWO
MAEHSSVCEEEIYRNFHQYNFDASPGFISGWIKIRDKIDPAKYEQELLKAKLFFYSRTVEKVDKEEYERWMVRYQLKDNKGSDIETFTDNHGHEAGSDRGDNFIQSNTVAIDHTSRRIEMKSDYVNLQDRTDDQLSGHLEEETRFCGTDNIKKEQKENSCKCSATYNDSNVLNRGSCKKAGAMNNECNGLKGGNCEKVDATDNKGNVQKGGNCEMHPVVHVNHDTEMEIKYREKQSADNYPASFLELISLLESGCNIPGIEELNVEPTNENPTPSALDRKKKPWEQ